MKILFMGTGAADWNISEHRGDGFFRRTTSALINDELLIDFNAGSIDFIEKNGTDMGKVRNILITHTHSDHYSRDAVNKVFGENVCILADAGAAARIGETAARQRVMPLYTPTETDGFTVCAVPANHSVEGSCERPLHYIISDGERCLFWGCDGAWLLNSAWHEMKKYTYDMVVLDGTLGDEEGDYRIFEHNNLRMVTEMAETVRNLNLMKENSKIMISHMSRYSQYAKDELERRLAPHNIGAAYDGLEIVL